MWPNAVTQALFQLQRYYCRRATTKGKGFILVHTRLGPRHSGYEQSWQAGAGWVSENSHKIYQYSSGFNQRPIKDIYMPGLQCMILTTLFAYNIRFRVCYDIIHFISCLMDDTCTSITFLSAAIIGPALSVCLVERWYSVSCSERAPVRFLFLPVRAISTGRVAGLPAD